MLFDLLNTAFADQAAAKQQLLAFLGTMRADDRIALYVLARDVAVLNDFTDDASHLARTLQNLRVRLPADLQSALDAPIPPSSRFHLGSLTEEANRLTANANQFLITERVRITTMAMRNIANHVTLFPAAKV